MKSLFFPPTAEAETAHPRSSIAAENSAMAKDAADSLVGEFSQRTLSDDELEAHIRDLGRLSEEAYAQGDPHGARLWSARMVKAICQRSPAKQAEMTAAIDRRITEGVDYFQSADALALGRRFG